MTKLDDPSGSVAMHLLVFHQERSRVGRGESDEFENRDLRQVSRTSHDQSQASHRFEINLALSGGRAIAPASGDQARERKSEWERGRERKRQREGESDGGGVQRKEGRVT
jgi:hypothetical protein